MTLLAQAAVIAGQLLPSERSLVVWVGGILFGAIVGATKLIIAQIGKGWDKMVAKMDGYEKRLSDHELEDTRRFYDVADTATARHEQIYGRVEQNNQRVQGSFSSLSVEFASLKATLEERMPKRAPTPPEGTPR